MLARDVGMYWTWLGDRHVVTVFADPLITIDTKTDERTTHGEHATYLEPARDERGAYYLVAAAPGDPRNGLWYLPRTALMP